LSDYVAYHVARGNVNDLQDLIKNYEQLIPEIFLNWIETGQVGCLFASTLSRKPRENRWLPIVQIGSLDEGDLLGEVLSARLDAAAEQGHEAAVVILPDIASERQIVTLVNLLCADRSGRWYRTDDSIDQGDGSLRLIGLRWILPSGASVNHVLGFAPIETMAATRRGPFTAMFFRILDKKRTPEKQEDGRVQVHLADLDSMFYPQAKHDKVSELTKKYRALHVEPTLSSGAKAKVTFALSLGICDSLCEARRVELDE
jgi:hypothetical protein